MIFIILVYFLLSKHELKLDNNNNLGQHLDFPSDTIYIICLFTTYTYM